MLGAATGQGLLLVEDLGEALAEYLERVPSARSELYTRAVRDLASAQVKLEPLPEGAVVRERGFDSALFTAELDHFGFGLVARGRPVGSGFRAARRPCVSARWAAAWFYPAITKRELMVLERGGARSLA